MTKFLSLLKAMMSQDMNLFVYRAKRNSSNAKKIIIPVLLSVLVMYSIGMYYYGFAIELSKLNLTYVILAVTVALPSILALVEGIYKSPSIIFEPKDNDLLFVLPIHPQMVLLARLIKLYVFQLLYGALFAIPGFLVFAYIEHPNAIFYLISVIMLIILPIIPTIIACMIGYFIKKVSVQFKARRAAQVLMTFILFFGILFFSFNSTGVMCRMLENATQISNTIAKVYYPVKAYLELIKAFNVVTLLKLLLLNTFVVALFIWLLSKYYFNIISKSNEKIVNIRRGKEISFKRRKQIKALIIKELKRYFSSTVYIFNTMFGLVLLLTGTIYLCFNVEKITSIIAAEAELAENIVIMRNIAPKLFYSMIVGMSFMTSITSSSISIEGKTFNISKGLPVETKQLLLAKIATSNIICIPIILICDVLFCISFKTTLFDLITILIISFVAPTISAMIGLFVNLKYPKMDASSDAEIIKQSMSAMISVFCGMITAGILIGFLFLGELVVTVVGIDYIILVELISLIVISAVMWSQLKKYGVKRYKEIEN